MKRFSRWRWALLCLFGLRHRKGEHWYTVGKGQLMRPLSRCTRCGVKGSGIAH